jgi:hypothetical protein
LWRRRHRIVLRLSSVSYRNLCRTSWVIVAPRRNLVHHPRLRSVVCSGERAVKKCARSLKQNDSDANQFRSPQKCRDAFRKSISLGIVRIHNPKIGSRILIVHRRSIF